MIWNKNKECMSRDEMSALFIFIPNHSISDLE